MYENQFVSITAPGRRVLGPVPFRRPDGTMIISNAGDSDRRAFLYGFDGSQQPTPESVKGKKLYRVGQSAGPVLLLHADSEAEAVSRFRKEMNIVRFAPDDEPQVQRERD